MKILPMLAVLIALVLAGCGGGYTPPPGGNSTLPKCGAPQDDVSRPKGPSRATQFSVEAKKADAAWTAFGRSRSAEDYAKCGAAIHNALRYRIEHEKNGHPTSNLRGLTDLNRLRGDWNKSRGQLNSEQIAEFESHPEYKKAFEAYQEVQSGN